MRCCRILTVPSSECIFYLVLWHCEVGRCTVPPSGFHFELGTPRVEMFAFGSLFNIQFRARLSGVSVFTLNLLFTVSSCFVINVDSGNTKVYLCVVL